MNEFLKDFEEMIKMLVSEEISRQLGPYTACQAHIEEPMTDKDEKEFLSIDELCELTGLKKATIYAKRTKREIPAYKFGRELRFKRSEVEDWIDAKRLTYFHSNSGRRAV
jgi:excisionase family DNA binding protein